MIVPSPTSLDQVSVSDEDSIFDTPSKAYLKARIRKFSQDKRNLQLINYNLVRKNKRLQAKCNHLKKIVSELKKKKIPCDSPQPDAGEN